MSHQFVGGRSGAGNVRWIDALDDADKNRHGGEHAKRGHDSAEMNSDHHRNQNVRNRVTYVVQVGTEFAAKPQLLCESSVQVIHDIVEYDERTDIQERILTEEDIERQDSQY